MGVGALLPFARGHKVKDGAPHEPWSFGPEVEASCRRSLTRRYRLLPYLYTVFEAAARTGVPVCRPAFFADPSDPRLRAVDNVFLIGEDLLVVAPVDGPGSADAAAVLPRGDWRELDITDEAVRAGRSPDPWQPRLFLRGGAVLPLAPAVQHTGELARGGPLTLAAALDATGGARGELYEDAGEGYGYREGDLSRVELVVEAGVVRTPGSRYTLAVVP
jgi:alpha-glucosidase